MRQYGIGDLSWRGDIGYGESKQESSKLDAGTSFAINGHREPLASGGFNRLDAMGPTEMGKRRP